MQTWSWTKLGVAAKCFVVVILSVENDFAKEFKAVNVLAKSESIPVLHHPSKEVPQISALGLGFDLDYQRSNVITAVPGHTLP